MTFGNLSSSGIPQDSRQRRPYFLQPPQAQHFFFRVVSTPWVQLSPSYATATHFSWFLTGLPIRQIVAPKRVSLKAFARTASLGRTFRFESLQELLAAPLLQPPLKCPSALAR